MPPFEGFDLRSLPMHKPLAWFVWFFVKSESSLSMVALYFITLSDFWETSLSDPILENIFPETFL